MYGRGSLSAPSKKATSLKRWPSCSPAGPPAANAVISTAAASFLRNDIEVLGILHGYSHLVNICPRSRWKKAHYVKLQSNLLSGRGTRRAS